jgi:hypothetical protein
MFGSFYSKLKKGKISVVSIMLCSPQHVSRGSYNTTHNRAAVFSYSHACVNTATSEKNVCTLQDKVWNNIGVMDSDWIDRGPDS